MAGPKNVAVIDIGKTNAKLVLVDLEAMAEIAVRRQPNHVLPGPPYPHYDVEGLWKFILSGLKALHAEHGIDAVTVTTHGASAALLDADGNLAAPVLDYEHDGPETISAQYDAVRPAFSETGSPRLPDGLNLGAQLFWQFEAFANVRKRTATILTYPQYWGYRLSGVAANEVTSLGCHTDLWNPHDRDFSSLANRMGWTQRMAPVRKATDLLGTVTPEVSQATGLSESTPVICGIHDSNASLYPHLASRTPPFSVVSTGTWVICMAVGSRTVALDPARDTLINVNAFGDPVPSARFMGGREFEILMHGREQGCAAGDIEAVLDRTAMLLPAVEGRSGPFQGWKPRWTVAEKDLQAGQRCAVVSFYLALMTATCLAMTGAEGSTIIEGSFAENAAFRGMLAAATGRPVISVAGTGTSIGSAMLADPLRSTPLDGEAIPVDAPEGLRDYAEKWQRVAAC